MNALPKIIPFPLEQAMPKTFQPPTMEDCLAHAATVGLPEREATKFYHYNMARDWMLGKNRIRRWKSAMAIWKMNWGGTVVGITRQNNPSRADCIAFAKSQNDTQGFVLSWYSGRSATNFINPHNLGWRELFIQDFNRWREAHK